MSEQKASHHLSRFTISISCIALPLLAVLFALLSLQGASASASTAAIKVGLIPGGPLSDNGFNWMSYQGLLRAETDFGVVGTVYTPTLPGDYAGALAQCATEGNALCISVGFGTSSAISEAATAYPSTKFAILDFTFASYPANLRGATFKVNDPAYLAGFLAGSMSESKVVGEIGGLEVPVVTDMTESFARGAQCANPGATAIITYTNDFVNPGLGAQVAQKLISRGADVIFVAAGVTGNGAVLTATQSGKWAVGVDTDQYVTLFNNGTNSGADKLLTSVLKRLDNAVYLTVQDVVSNTFTSGTQVFSLANDGVGLAPFHEADSAIPPAVKSRMEQLNEDIAEGRLDVDSPRCESYIHLPVLIK